MPIGSVASVDKTGTDLATSAQQGLTANKQDFLQLLVAQMTNQDPLSPMDNQQFVAQLAQMQSLEELMSINKLSSSVLQQQQISSSSNLIGKSVFAKDDFGGIVTGVVEKVQIVGGDVRLVVGGTNVSISTVQEISGGEDGG